MTDDEMVKVAQQHGGRYLIEMSDWLDKDSDVRLTCDHLVRSGRARWLNVKHAGEDGEPGPGIQLLGRDLQNAAE